jgi:hypothetical protein
MVQSLRCTAHNRQGGVCGHWATPGQRVCFLHGSKSPQAVANAEERLKALVHPAITGLQELINKADSDSVRLSAIKDVLDRAGYRAADAQPDVAAQTMHITLAFDRNEPLNANGTTTLSLDDAQ